MCMCLSVCMYVWVSVGVCIFTYGYILVCFPLTYPFSCFFIITLSSLTVFCNFCSDLRDHSKIKAFLPFLSEATTRGVLT